MTRPYPGAFAFLEGEKVFVWKAREVPSKNAGPGTVLAVEPLTVACGKGAIVLEEIEPKKKIQEGSVLS